MTTRLIVVCVLLGTSIASSLTAQLAVWDVAGTNAETTNPLSASSLGTNVASASLTLGGGVSASGAAGTFGGSNFDTTSLTAAITSGDYLSFTITPTSGYALSISSITLNSGVSTEVTNFNVSLLSSATGWTAAQSLHDYSFASTGAPAQSITLTSSPALQNVSGSLEFRLYGWRDPNGTSTFRIRNLAGSDLVINGTVSAIPEPSAYAAAAGLFILGCALWRRRSRGCGPLAPPS